MACASQNDIRVWEVKPSGGELECVRRLVGHLKGVTAIELTGDTQMASASEDRTVKVWSLTSWRLVRTLTGHTGTVTALKYLGNRMLATASLDKTIRIWNLYNGECMRTIMRLFPNLFAR